MDSLEESGIGRGQADALEDRLMWGKQLFD